MNRIKLAAILLAFAIIPGTSFGAKNENGEKIDLSSIEAALSALTNRVTDLETELAEKQVTGDFVDTHSGTYDVFIVELKAYGCGNTSDFGSLPDPAARFDYFSSQAISSISYSTGRTSAISDGLTLTILDGTVTDIETRLSGKSENEEKANSIPPLTLAGDGTLSIAGTPLGSMSADGTVFQLLGNFADDDNGCQDTSATYISGHRN